MRCGADMDGSRLAFEMCHRLELLERVLQGLSAQRELRLVKKELPEVAAKPR